MIRKLFLDTFKGVIVAGTIACLMAFLVVGLVFYAANCDSKIERLEIENQYLKKENQRLLQEIQEIKLQNHIERLSSEFGVGLNIASTVFALSEEVVDYTRPRYREIQDANDMARIVLALIKVESGGNGLAVGDDGRALGLFQIWLSTARQYDAFMPASDLHDLGKSSKVFFVHFFNLLDRYGGDVALALCAYNQGSGRVDRILAKGRSPLNEYVAKIYDFGSGASTWASAPYVVPELRTLPLGTQAFYTSRHSYAGKAQTPRACREDHPK